MIVTASQHDVKALKAKIGELLRFFANNGDMGNANKAKQLLIKLSSEEYTIAFCGHFSAGKSSMINKLIGENLLPSSPIPTSANLVKIKSGEEYARVNFKKGNPRLYPAPYNYEKVKSYAKDGDAIQSIEISHRTNALPVNACIMDTPGIDSTDDAHRVATESALHLADLVFYVMDYNHVQSELNFLFTKELTDAGKEVYLIINQIDKHRNEELSFEDFKNSVLESFTSWGVTPAEIFYTSLKAVDHEDNDYERLKGFIDEKLERRKALLPTSIFHSLKKLTEEHERFLKEQNEEKLNDCERILASLTEDEQADLEQNLLVMEQRLKEITTEKKVKERDLEASLDDILKSAYLMPFETRQLAERYLEATQSDFKVGLFFTKQKTEQERQERLERFHLDFQEKVSSQLIWHVKELFNKTLKNEGIHNQELLTAIQNFDIAITKEMLEKTVKPGARMSGDYVLNYTEDVAQGAKKAVRQGLTPIKEAYLELVERLGEEARMLLVEKKEQLTTLFLAYQKKKELIDAQTANRIAMEQFLTGEYESTLTVADIAEWEKENETVEIVVEQQWETEERTAIQQTKEIPAPTKTVPFDGEERVGSVVSKLKYSANRLHVLPGFKKISNLLMEKAERLEKRTFTVALFGAFSAGKSSFANSLLGERLLPVSPNPTTAAINKIMPVDGDNTHGNVKVQLKTAEVLFEDVTRSLAIFDLHAKDFDEVLQHLKKMMEQPLTLAAHEKTHFSFLQAFYRGFGDYRTQLGEVITTDLEQFRDFVAIEEKSCFVELIEVYYDCELTRKGITLVDTPGADSINARHTGVAFDYIKNSDVILFVTYYNHAFSKADREFLIQLGRVKDSFAMDKMFFIVNAVDLANNESEKLEVLEFVHNQLVKYGIRKPKLYPISSLLALEEKLQGRKRDGSGILPFEEAFYSFIANELMETSIHSALIEWERALEQLRSFIHSAKEDREHKEKRIIELQEEQTFVEQLILDQNSHLFLQRLQQEITELTYYIRQRVYLRFHDFFKEAFNPSVLKDDGRNLKKVLLHCLDDFLETFGFDFAQEYRATSLRIENYIGKLILEAHEGITQSVQKHNEELLFSKHQLGKMEGIPFENELSQLDRALFKKALDYFKNPKSFFEKNEKRFMLEALNNVLQQPTDDYMKLETEKLTFYYDGEFQREYQEFKNLLLEEAKEYYEGMVATLGNEIPVERLIEIERELRNR